MSKLKIGDEILIHDRYCRILSLPLKTKGRIISEMESGWFELDTGTQQFSLPHYCFMSMILRESPKHKLTKIFS